MEKRFRSFDNLRSFTVVARYLSFTRAATELNLTKGAVSYQINRLELELGFELFKRHKQGIVLTDKGQRLLQVSRQALGDIENEIASLRMDTNRDIAIGMSTYFASRWLSPRLMTFMASHPEVGLRIQPLIDLSDLRRANIDMAIRWGKGDWEDGDTETERLFPCAAMLSCSNRVHSQIEPDGIELLIKNQTLLHDRDDSSAWQDWFLAAGLAYDGGKKKLVIPDPNVRVQAVIDNQGVALNDMLINNEVERGLLSFYTEITLDDYGYYLVYARKALNQPALSAFRDWLVREACQ